MELREKDFNKLVQKKIDDPKTQAKAVYILKEIHNLKEDDLEAFAIAALVMKTFEALPDLNQYQLKKKPNK